MYRYSPDGLESERIDLPARKVSCITFGGESYDELFLTTALAGGSRESEGAGAGALFRGIEKILENRHPWDAVPITQRICGVCPQSHGIAATLNLDSAFGIADKIPDNGRIIRNLIQGAHVAQDHILHFYHLVALDYVNVNSTGLIPKGFLCPNYDSNYYARGIDPVLQTGGLGAPAYTVNNAPTANPGIPDTVSSR